MSQPRVALFLLLLLVVAAGAQTERREEPADPSALCQRWPDRPECKLFIENQAVDSQAPTPAPKFQKRPWRPTPVPQPTQTPTPEPTACTTADDAVARAVANPGQIQQLSRICPCQRGQGRVKGYLHDPADRSDQARVIEVCDSGADYRLDGVLVIPKDENHPAFAQAALDDLSVIGSISDPSGHVGFEFLVQLIQALGKSTLPVEDRSVHIRWGVARNRAQRGKVGPYTHPGSSGDLATNAQWQAATARGLDVYASDGVPVGGRKRYFGGLLKGTGTGVGSSVFYEPEMLPDPQVCPSGSTSDIALLHELEHAARMALGEVDNTPYPNLWLNRDPLAAMYGVHEEKLIVELENEYRAALEREYPRRYPNLRPRKSYLGDC